MSKKNCSIHGAWKILPDAKVLEKLMNSECEQQLVNSVRIKMNVCI